MAHPPSRPVNSKGSDGPAARGSPGGAFEARESPPTEADPFGYALVRDYVLFALRAPRRHKVLAATAFLSMLAVGIAAANVLPARYQVQASILALRSPLMSNLSNPGMNREWDAPTRAAREVVIRRENLIQLAKQTHFVERYLEHRSIASRARAWLMQTITGRQRDREQVLEDLVDTLVDRLWVVVSPEGTVTFTLQWSDAETAVQLVQAAMQSFLDERYASEIRAVGETVAILNGHDAQVQRQIATTVAALEEKEKSLRIRAVPRLAAGLRARLPDEELARLDASLAARRRALGDLETFRQQRLAELQAQLAQQQGVYATDHPSLRSTRQAIESLSQPSPQIIALRTETQELERDLARRSRAVDGDAAARGGVLQNEMAEARLRLLETEDPRLEMERRQLEDLLRQHSTLLQRIDAARVEMDTAEAAFKYRYTVIAPPQLPKGPIKPYGVLFVTGGVLGGLVLALFVSAAADLRSGIVIEPWQVERALDLPIVGGMRR